MNTDPFSNREIQTVHPGNILRERLLVELMEHEEWKGIFVSSDDFSREQASCNGYSEVRIVVYPDGSAKLGVPKAKIINQGRLYQQTEWEMGTMDFPYILGNNNITLLEQLEIALIAKQASKRFYNTFSDDHNKAIEKAIGLTKQVQEIRRVRIMEEDGTYRGSETSEELLNKYVRLAKHESNYWYWQFISPFGSEEVRGRFPKNCRLPINPTSLDRIVIDKTFEFSTRYSNLILESRIAPPFIIPSIPDKWYPLLSVTGPNPISTRKGGYNVVMYDEYTDQTWVTSDWGTLLNRDNRAFSSPNSNAPLEFIGVVEGVQDLSWFDERTGQIKAIQAQRVNADSKLFLLDGGNRPTIGKLLK